MLNITFYRPVSWYPSSMSKPYLQRYRANVCATYYKASENNNAIDDDNNRYINTLIHFCTRLYYTRTDQLIGHQCIHVLIGINSENTLTLINIDRPFRL